MGSQNDFDLVLSKINLLDVLEKYNYDISQNPGDCPFHNSEHKHSFSFNDDLFHCFAPLCNKSGNLFHFIELKDNCSRYDALVKAASIAGITLDQKGKSKEQIQKEVKERDFYERKLACLNAAVDLFHNNLTPDMIQKIKDERGWSDNTIKKFKIGYSIKNIKALLMAKGFSEKEINEGLVSEKGFEYFQERIVFPYMINNQAKYLIGRKTPNTPEDSSYNKSKYVKLSTTYLPNILFQANVNRTTKTIVITEGIADAISISESGYAVVSPVTIRFKKDDLPRIKDFCKDKEVYIMNDNEISEYGEVGAVETAEYLFEEGIMNVNIVNIPRSADIQKIDACEFLRDKQDKNVAVKGLIENNSEHILEYLIGQVKSHKDFDNIDKFLQTASNAAEDFHRETFLKLFSEKSKISVSDIKKKIDNKKKFRQMENQKQKKLEEIKQLNEKDKATHIQEILDDGGDDFSSANSSGLLNDGTLYWTVPVYTKGKYNFFVLTESGVILKVFDNTDRWKRDLETLKATSSDVEELEDINEKLEAGPPEKEKYKYFVYDNVEYRYQKKLFFNKRYGINVPSKGVFSYFKEKDIKQSINKYKLHQDLIEKIKEYFDHNSEIEYELITPMVYITYLCHGLGRTYYQIFSGREDSGKSTLQQVLAYLQMYGWFGGKSSIAFAVRLLNFLSISLNIDEVEKMAEDDKLIFVGVLNSGLNSRGTYNIVNNQKKDEEQLELYETFGTKSFSMNIENIEREFGKSFLSRCYLLFGTRKNRKTFDIKKLSVEDREKFQELTDRIFVYCLTHYKEICQSILSVQSTLESEGIFGRKTDVNSIILGIIKHFNDDPKNTKYQDCKKALQQKDMISVKEARDSVENALFEHLAKTFIEEAQKNNNILPKIHTFSNPAVTQAINTALNLKDTKQFGGKTIKSKINAYGLIKKEDQLGRDENGITINIYLTDLVDILGRYPEFGPILEQLRSLMPKNTEPVADASDAANVERMEGK